MRVRNPNKMNKRDLRVKLKPLTAHICHILASSMLVGSMSWMQRVHAAPPLPLPVPPGATWNKPRFSLPQVSMDPDHWRVIGENKFQSGTTTATYSENNLDVEQNDQRVILNWESFDIDVNNQVQFRQPGAAAIALNRIHEAALPSQILGSLRANGQLYLINKNGFIFGSSSVVDVNSLVVSTLDVDDEVFMRGITTHFDETGEAAFAAFEGQEGEIYLRDPDTNDFLLDEQGQRIKIKIDIKEGANISSAEKGRIMMFAPSITNSGDITSEEGQAILAATTDKVYLQQSGGDNGINGLLVEVETGGDVSNLGKIITERGNTTLMGFAVNQEGLISATTSVHSNGSIRLLAREGKTVIDDVLVGAASTTRDEEKDDGLGTQAKVTLGPGSQTNIDLHKIEDPDNPGEYIYDPTTAADGTAQPKSKIELFGQTVHLKENSEIISPSAEVEITATENPSNPEINNTEKNDARILVEVGSVIDVSGIEGVRKAMESNVLEVKLQSEHLADSPVQKNGILFGETVYFDLRKDTEFANISGELAGIQRDVAERNTEGGTVNFSSQGDVILEDGSVIDISGGSVIYEEGYIDTTSLITNEGRIVGINDANPEQLYAAIVGKVSKDYDKWGVTRTWQVSGPIGAPLREAGYIEAQDAGTVDITTHNLILDGDIVSKQDYGHYQRNADSRSRSGSLNINLALHRNSYQNVVFQNNKTAHALEIDDEFPADNSNNPQPLRIESDYFVRNGLQNVSINTYGDIKISNSSRLVLPDDAEFTLSGHNVQIEGDVIAKSGQLNFSSKYFNEQKGDIIISENSLLDVSGQWINDSLLLNPEPDFTPVFINAGSINLDAEGDLIFSESAIIDARGGAWYQSNGEFAYGSGGDVLLKTELEGSSTQLVLDGKIKAHSFKDAGTFSITANGIHISSTNIIDTEDSHIFHVNADTLFDAGFSNYHLNANLGSVIVKSGTHLRPDKESLVLAAGYDTAKSYTSLDEVTTTDYLQYELRTPVNLKLTQKDTVGKDETAIVSMEKNTSITSLPEASVEISSVSSIYLDGKITTPGGKIDLRIDVPGIERGFKSDQGIWLGNDSQLSVAGTYIPEQNIFGLEQGRLLDAGEINLLANRGYIIMASGAEMDASGTEPRLDVADPTYLGLGRRIIREKFASDAGTISITASEGVLAEGIFNAKANKSLGAEGGQLLFTLDQTKRSSQDPNFASTFPASEATVHVLEQNQYYSDGFAMGEDVPDHLNGKAFVSESVLNESGFDSVSLTALGKNPDTNLFTGTIEFHDNAGIIADRQVILNAPKIVSHSENAVNSLLSSYVSLGARNKLVESTDSSGGTADFLVSANLIDLVNITSLQGYDLTELKSNSDIRLIGELQTNDALDYTGSWNSSGQLVLSAQQVYPTTLTEFSISSDNITVDRNNHYASTLLNKFNGRLESIINKVPASADNTLLLSAAGKLTLNADTITQAGTIRAPFGEIHLNAGSVLTLANGSLTSTSANNDVIPFGQTQGGLDWLYPIGTNLKIFDAPPAQSISFKGDNIEYGKGATVDISGGGDLQSYEFVKGPDGNRDIFSLGDGFAVIPGISQYSPYDPSEYPGSGIHIGDRVYLSGYEDLPEGEYAILPAHYALLEGAYFVRPQSGLTGIREGEVTARIDGTPIISGKYNVAGTNIRDALWQGFAIEKGHVASQRAKYTLSHANTFYTQKAIENETSLAFIPADAGQISFDPGQSLTLEGELLAQPGEGGRGGRLDINTDNRDLLIVDSVSDSADVTGVELAAEQLNALGIDSILLGGTRKQTDNGTEISIGASNVIVKKNEIDNNELELYAPEIILAASDSVVIGDGSKVSGQGTSYSSIDNIHIDGEGAVFRASSSAQVSVSRSGVADNQSQILIEAGASIAAEKSILLASGSGADIDGTIELENGSLNLAAEIVNLGDSPENAEGIVLDETLLSSLNLDELVLTAHGQTNVYSGFSADAKRLVLDTELIKNKLDDSLAADEAMALINADTIRFTHSQTLARDYEFDPESNPGHSQGTLMVNARQIELGEGGYAFSGFDGINVPAADPVAGVVLSASEQILAQGNAKIHIDSDLQLQAARIAAQNGADTTIVAPGQQIIISASDINFAGNTTGVAARLAMESAAIRHSGHIVLPAGQLELTATHGNVDIDDGSIIDVSGVAVDFEQGTAYLSGGKLILQSETHGVRIADTASINLSAAAVGDAGQLEITTANDSFSYAGQIEADSTSGKGGQFVLDTTSLANGLDDLSSRLAQSGFDEKIHIRSRTDNLLLSDGAVLKARDIKLTSDQGSIQVDGEINASGIESGEVRLSSADTLLITGQINAFANGIGNEGGYVELASIDNATDGVAGINNLGTINVSSGSDGKAGEVYFRALRMDTNSDGQADNINVSAFGNITGAGKIIAEAVRVYEDANIINSNTITRINTDNTRFINAVNLSHFTNNGISLLPGVELRSSADMRIQDEIDLSGLRYGTSTNIPGVLSLRAGEDLNIDADLSDGFINESVYGFYQYLRLQSSESWRYRLIAGADSNSTDVMAVQSRKAMLDVDGNIKGNLNLADDTFVRTGTGDIQIATANNINLMNESSVIYAGGRETETSPWGTLSIGTVYGSFLAQYPVDGGDLDIYAGGDINSTPSDQFVRDWLISAGDPDDTNPENRLSAWGIAFEKPSLVSRTDTSFKQGLAAFGGGNMSVTVKGDMNDVSIMLPGSGKQTGAIDGLGNRINEVTVTPGGKLDLSVDGDVAGGMFYLANGDADIDVSGSLKPSSHVSGNGFSPVLAMGDAKFTLDVKKDISISAVIDPMIIKRNNRNQFFSYTENAELEMLSMSGDIVLRNHADELPGMRADDRILDIYPASLSATSASGKISIEDSLALFPSTQGNLKLWAKNVIEIGNSLRSLSINLSDADPELLPTALNPAANFSGSSLSDVNKYFSKTDSHAFSHARIPLHTNDANAVSIVAKEGSITSAPDSGGAVIFNLSKKASIYAGHDIRDVSFKIQNVNNDDYSSIYAGRDIVYTTSRTAGGSISKQEKLIRVSGPGSLSVQAGRDIDLGSSIGIESVGNTLNTALADRGADLFVLAGVKGKPDYDAFAQQYIYEQDEYAAGLVHYLDTGNVDFELETVVSTSELESARTGFANLSEDKQQKFIRKVFYQELLVSGTQAVKEDNTSYYQQGYDAIEKLFPNESYQGDVKLFFSKIQTLDGGDIEFLAPGGLINAGLATTEGLTKEAKDLGVVAFKEGGISAFLGNNLEVNESRVFALGGDDILVWSSEGDIDAGRGAKSAISAPAAKYTFDASGNIVVELPPAVEGSGIRTSSSGDALAGSVALFAPKGIVNAGEAGIGCGELCIIGANEVVNVDNIDIGNASFGIPAASGSLAAGLTGVSDLSTSASKLAEESTSSIGDAGEAYEEMATGFLNIELVGFGDGVKIQKK